MVGGVPVGLALRDLFYAAGLGFLLCVGYSAARMLLGSGKAVSATPLCWPWGRFWTAARP